ncbi:MAG TPA: hypothetical protein VHM23_12360 [Actinomycetota bacterium]|jgi:hypothetical protein|nr:hypothetical protein [Actinomycetota bacterium]
MSRRTHALVVGAILAAMQLAATTAVAHAQADNDGKNARQPPTQGQVGEAWHQPQKAADAPAVADGRRPPTESQVGEPWRHQTNVQTNVPIRSTRPDGPQGWRIASLGFLAAALVVSGGALTVFAVRRSGHSTRVGPVA